MTRLQWAVIGLAGVPTLLVAFTVSALFGPIGATVFGGLLLASVNVHHLFHGHKDDA